MNQCKDCGYYVAHTFGDVGDCRCHAPSMPLEIKLPGSYRDPYTDDAIWPKVRRDYGCGDWEARETAIREG